VFVEEASVEVPKTVDSLLHREKEVVMEVLPPHGSSSSSSDPVSRRLRSALINLLRGAGVTSADPHVAGNFRFPGKERKMRVVSLCVIEIVD
jgi:hypothetical protein